MQHNVMRRVEAIRAFSRTGDKILRPFEHDAQFFKAGKVEATRPAGRRDPLRASKPDARYAQQRFVRCAVDLDRELLGMVKRPVAFGIQKGIELRISLIEQLGRRKAIKPQQPVRLVQPVFAQQRRFCV